jgi:L,D-transpeptidase ErfK/SrfK
MNVQPTAFRLSGAAAKFSLLMAASILAGCQTLAPQAPPEPVAAPEPPPPVYVEPVATHRFELQPGEDVVGELQVTRIQGEDTFSDIARRFNVGYEEMVRANPGVDPWVPGVGREVVVPTLFVLPDAPREGLVINLAQLRVYYFPPAGEGEPQTVITHPIGVGKVGWSTPIGTTKITGKAKNPSWFPPASVRKEHREAGDPLPGRVPPGPDNPLGAYLMTLGWPSYLVHGTNKPYGVGMRSSHGCIRFYPEDIEQLYGDIPVGTKVTVVNQPFVFGWRGSALFVQAFPIAEDDEREHPAGADALLNAAISDEMWRTVREHDVAVDLALVNVIAADSRGVAVPVSHPVQRAETPPKSRRKNQPPPPAAPAFSMDRYLAAARHVENRLPEGSNWNGKDELLVSSEEFEATRNGIILPNESQPKKAAKPAKKAKATKAPAARTQPKRTATVVADEKLEVETPASANTSAVSTGKSTRGAGAP